ncbi:MAG: azurin [Cytophagales bacterium]|nr:azurin [Cytophagales bacterium]
MTKYFAVILVMVFLAACGGGGESSGSGENETAAKTETKATGELVKVVVNSDDQMKFDTDEIKVPAGSKVELTLNHTGSFPKESMGHNLVILSQGVDLNDYAQRAMSESASNYVIEGDEIIAATIIIGGGESTTITFDAPAAGTYQFVCTFPGHFFAMQGNFIVE